MAKVADNEGAVLLENAARPRRAGDVRRRRQRRHLRDQGRRRSTPSGRWTDGREVASKTGTRGLDRRGQLRRLDGRATRRRCRRPSGWAATGTTRSSTSGGRIIYGSGLPGRHLAAVHERRARGHARWRSCPTRPAIKGDSGEGVPEPDDRGAAAATSSTARRRPRPPRRSRSTPTATASRTRTTRRPTTRDQRGRPIDDDGDGVPAPADPDDDDADRPGEPGRRQSRAPAAIPAAAVGGGGGRRRLTVAARQTDAVTRHTDRVSSTPTGPSAPADGPVASSAPPAVRTAAPPRPDRVVPSWADPVVAQASEAVGGPWGRHAVTGGRSSGRRCGSACCSPRSCWRWPGSSRRRARPASGAARSSTPTSATPTRCRCSVPTGSTPATCPTSTAGWSTRC